MGELLKTASSVQNGQVVDYNWFAEALTHFDDFLETIDREAPERQYAVPKHRQLRLLEVDNLDGSS